MSDKDGETSFYTTLEEIAERAPEGATHYRWSSTLKRFKVDRCPEAIPLSSDPRKVGWPSDCSTVMIRYFSSGAAIPLDANTAAGKRAQQRAMEGCGDVLLVRPNLTVRDPSYLVAPGDASPLDAITLPALTVPPEGATQADLTSAIVRGALAGQQVAMKQGQTGAALAVQVLNERANKAEEKADAFEAQIRERGDGGLVAVLMSDTATRNAEALIGAGAVALAKLFDASRGKAGPSAEEIRQIVQESVTSAIAPVQRDLDARLRKVEKPSDG